jgi:hypothetical protein
VSGHFDSATLRAVSAQLGFRECRLWVATKSEATADTVRYCLKSF